MVYQLASILAASRMWYSKNGPLLHETFIAPQMWHRAIRPRKSSVLKLCHWHMKSHKPLSTCGSCSPKTCSHGYCLTCEVCVQHDTVPQSNWSASETSLADRQVDLTNEIRESDSGATKMPWLLLRRFGSKLHKLFARQLCFRHWDFDFWLPGWPA